MQGLIPGFRKGTRIISRRKWGNAWLGSLLLMPGPWLLVDIKRETIICSSKAFEAVLGMGSRSTYNGCAMSLISHQSDPSDWTVKTFDRSLVERPGRYEDVALQKPDGSSVIVDIHVSHPPRSRYRPTAICLITDRTEQRRLQDELIAKHKELRRAFANLEKTQKTLEASNRQLSQTSAKLSRATELAAIGEITAELAHQLNNPLAAAVGALRRIEKLERSSTDPQLSPMVALLKHSLDRLASTVSELRRVYLTSRPVDSEKAPFDLKLQVDGALALLQQRVQNMDVVVDMPDALPPIYGRPSQIQHVIINLCDNAIQAAGDVGKIRLTAISSEDAVVFTVEDSGPGIPENKRKKVFEPFYTTREFGSGLGLAVVKRHLDNDSASIHIGESRDGGAKFTICFPIATQRKDST
ncbi:MAG: HAMP domain-containing sensor histidine kinase [Myxococcota bacterium]|nr:HAMP domain-containing sensor histidine kinase [Myxococcota bacterium]